jgi:hypothetical protein
MALALDTSKFVFWNTGALRQRTNGHLNPILTISEMTMRIPARTGGEIPLDGLEIESDKPRMDHSLIEPMPSLNFRGNRESSQPPTP